MFSALLALVLTAQTYEIRVTPGRVEPPNVEVVETPTPEIPVLETVEVPVIVDSPRVVKYKFKSVGAPLPIFNGIFSAQPLRYRYSYKFRSF